MSALAHSLFYFRISIILALADLPASAEGCIDCYQAHDDPSSARSEGILLLEECALCVQDPGVVHGALLILSDGVAVTAKFT